MTLGLSLVGSTAVAQHDAMENVIGAGAQTVLHDQDIAFSESRLLAELGLTKSLAAGISFPMRVFATSIRYLDMSGSEVDIENPFVHHNNDTHVGPGDPWLFVRYAKTIGGFTLGGRLGVAVPLGRTEEDPFVLGDMGIAHEHSQFGAGTFQPILGLDVARGFGSIRGELYALTVQSLYENRHDYKAGDRYAVGIAAGRTFGGSWRFRLTTEAQIESAERWSGTVHAEEGNTGRMDFLAGLEATYKIKDTWFLSAQIKVPVYTDVQGGQLESSPFLGLSLHTSFQLFGGEDEHAHGDGHDHGDDHGHDDDHHHDSPVDWTGLDKQDVADPAAALVPVPGKITVFDLWATWCKPCKVLDRELAELARKYPQLAIRKVDVADVDSPAYRKHLRDAMIPHVKVFGPDGKLLAEQSGGPEELAKLVESLVK